jgi:REP element-mobilizing transposase RayT
MGLLDEPLAYLLTWTCKGARLHGDERGSVDRDHNGYGTPTLTPNSRWVAAAAQRMKCQPTQLAGAGRDIVTATLHEVAAHRGWEILAAAVRSNHVHVVVVARGRKPEPVMTDLKAWSTRRLRERGQVAAADAVWARHGSTRYLWNEQQVAAAVEYVREAQDLPRE